MVRFIIGDNNMAIDPATVFTFQYGQIYYKDKPKTKIDYDLIYIPIWLDLLYDIYIKSQILLIYLHSNMVRFIIF